MAKISKKNMEKSLSKVTLKSFIGKAQYDQHGQMLWGITDGDKMQLLARNSGWGAIQNLFKTEAEALEFQDSLGKFIADAINEKTESLKDAVKAFTELPSYITVENSQSYDMMGLPAGPASFQLQLFPNSGPEMRIVYELQGAAEWNNPFYEPGRSWLILIEGIYNSKDLLDAIERVKAKLKEYKLL